MKYDPNEPDFRQDGDESRSREPSFGLCQNEVAILHILRQRGQAGIQQIKIAKYLADLFEGEVGRGADLAGRIWANSGKIYTSCGKLCNGFDPKLAGFAFSKNGRPPIYLTADGSRVLDQIIKIIPNAGDPRWLMESYYAERDAKRNPKLILADQLRDMGLTLNKSSS